jgi:alkaline phosphatase
MLNEIDEAMADIEDPTENRRAAVDAMLPILSKHTGIESLAPREHVALQEAVGSGRALNFAVADLIGQRTLIGWTTGGHTAVDVKLHAYGPGTERFRGHLDNTDVGLRLAELLGFDLEALTTALRDESKESSTAGSR